MPCPPPGDIPDPGNEPAILCLANWEVGSLPLATIRQRSGQVSRGSAGDYQADEKAGHAAPLASIRQMSRQVSRGSAGEYQADDQALVAHLRWRV